MDSRYFPGEELPVDGIHEAAGPPRRIQRAEPCELQQSRAEHVSS